MGAEELQELKEQLDRIEKASVIQFKETLTLEEAAIYVGRSKNTIYRLTADNTLAFFRPGGKMIYIEKKELDRWMRQGCVQSNDYLATKAANILYTKQQ